MRESTNGFTVPARISTIRSRTRLQIQRERTFYTILYDASSARGQPNTKNTELDRKYLTSLDVSGLERVFISRAGRISRGRISIIGQSGRNIQLDRERAKHRSETANRRSARARVIAERCQSGRIEFEFLFNPVRAAIARAKRQAS